MGTQRVPKKDVTSLVGSLGLSCQYKRFLFFRGLSSGLSTKYFFLTLHYIDLSLSPSKLGRQSCWVAYLLVCVSGMQGPKFYTNFTGLNKTLRK